MEQFRRIGEVVGSLKALMVLRDEIQINQSQCCLILDIFNLAFDTIAEEIKQNLVLEERNTKWKPLEYPMRELCRVFKEGELYIRQCLDSKDWWGKVISFHHNNDSVEFHIHNLLCYFPAVIEAIEVAGEVSGHDQDEMKRKRAMLMRKYDRAWNEPKLFQRRFGKQYLVSGEISKQFENAWREDRWRLIELLKEKMTSTRVSLTKNEHGLADMLIKKLLNGPEKLNKKLFPTSILLGSKDYQVRRRLGSGREFKEIQWMGQSFALRNVNGEMQIPETEICTLLSLSHPNIVQYLCGFHDEEKKEFFLVMELMNKDLESYIKDNYGPRRQILFSIPVVVDIMLQIARGMEYLHSKKVYHGDLSPCSILLKSRNSQEGYFQVKVTGFGSSMKIGNNQFSSCQNPLQEEANPSIWYYAPEVLTEIEHKTNISNSNYKYSEKADVYSFSMVCFQLLTGKVPFEGNGSNRNIKEGERPLFPYPSPKYVVNLIKKCWQTDPSLRPTFSSICRILRSIKKFLAINTEFLIINPELNQLELTCPPVDYCDIEALFLKSFQTEKASLSPYVSQIPYEMFAYKIIEKEKISPSITKDKSFESLGGSICKEENFKDENAATLEDPSLLATDTKSSSDLQSICSEVQVKKSTRIKWQTKHETKKDQGALRLQPSRSLATKEANHNSRMIKGNRLASSISRIRAPQVLDSKNNIGSQSTSLIKSSSSIRRIRHGQVTSPKSMSKTKTGNESSLTRRGHFPDFKSSLQMKKGIESPLTRSSHVLNYKSSLKMKKGNESPLMGSTRKLRHPNLKMTSRNMSPYAMSPFSFNTCSRRCGQVSNFDLSYKMDRGRISPFAMSPLSPYARTCGHISQSQRSYNMKRASLSPLKLSPLSPYMQRNGHISD